MSQHTPSHSLHSSLQEWLCYLEHLHNQEIDLGLARIGQVATRLDIRFDFAKVITVAGTNGKGTTCAFLENALLGQGKSVAVYSSPHIERFNERLRINRQDCDDQAFICAFVEIEQARGDISLSYYEFTTLAAFLVLMARKPDVIILEVGLGGRLDATNTIDADIAVITTIDLDHQAFLGDTREAIGYEKAGIMRANTPVVVGDKNPPQSLLDHGNSLEAEMYLRERDFFVSGAGNTAGQGDGINWQWRCGQTLLPELKLPSIPQDNVATALMVLALLEVELSGELVNGLIRQTRVPGRTEMFHLQSDIMLDVGHNPQAARYLAGVLAQKRRQENYRRVFAVVGMLADKDISNTLKPLAEDIDAWYLGTLDGPRAAKAQEIARVLPPEQENINCFDNVTQAFKMACNNAKATDLILVFGSFFTVAEIRRLLV
ncbi:bifunctional tetrahydrofolate synthase/dihydrofolate synthase [Thalassomonas viridans]|uniref:Dihydrofolate synthase/folylpolyglutamate synthase n=1 Tax=Thalassomonas viridans TaxID=137584 RepID=A0AAE9YZ22_9GAMM|nr:bifunctional tetrahydrofolate synthase/dihydrofolate synthase [Thalassomonas viridans]WDE03573.1 bifunctional tetrahydrofolate synthase/dihydrofolate synthase [Thalassomonas viridans]